ncbi:hypothetical protein Q1695_009415 [Nippostrongylus brasiliensis]|nr:hypothetical protein Q1695_009415 [Nippostrongylus brasiliensis]
MHHGLYSFNEANNNTVNDHGLESIYTTLTANQLPLGSESLPSGRSGAFAAASTMTVGEGRSSSADMAILADHTMTIDEHLQSMPMPMTCWNDQQFRSQEEIDMLTMGSSRGALQGPALPSQLHPVIVSRCDGAVASSSETSPSSCSPASTENLHQQPAMKCSDGVSQESSVASILNHTLKPEPSDASDFSADSNCSATHGLTGQPMSLNLAATYGGRCSDGSGASGPVSTTSGSSTPAPVRRSRSSHDGMLKCQFCPKKWADQNALHTHMADCRMMRGHECSQCGKRFKARGGLQQHLRIHSNDRPYSCHFCAKRFTQKSHVDQHERIHTGAKPFTCQFCGRAFRQRSQQLGHEATHSNASGVNSHLVTSPTGQQNSGPATPSPRPQHQVQQQQQELSRNEYAPTNGLIHELVSPLSPSPSSMSTNAHLSLLALGQVAPPNTNTAVSSLLALSQSPSVTPATPPSSHHFEASSHLHQTAVGLLNGLH